VRATGNPLNPHSRSLSKYPLGINHDKNAPALGQHFSFRVPDFCQMREPPSALRELPRFDTQRGLKRYRLQVIDADFRGHGSDPAELIQFAHGVVEDGGDDSTVTISRWTGVAPSQPEAADKSPAALIEPEPEPHPLPVILSTGKTVISLLRHVGAL
jgi:hypothetical protein